MASTTSNIVPPFDFSAAMKLPVPDRFEVCLNRARVAAKSAGYGEFMEEPCVPNVGASDIELDKMERELGVRLPAEYRFFLSRCRYLKIGDGFEVGGLDYEGVYVAEVPWLSEEHRSGVPYLVFADYWRFADGDQLMFDLSVSDSPVVAYLHEHGPLFEAYAPSFTLALWRLLHENG